jgi:hypothetical protein
MDLNRILQMLDNPTTLSEALDQAEKMLLTDNDRVVFNQKRMKYYIGMDDYGKVNWIIEMKGFLKTALSDQADAVERWHHLDMKIIKQKFRKLWLDKKSFVKVIFIENDEKSFSHFLHNILKTYYERELLHKPIGEIKGKMSDTPDLSDSKQLKIDYSSYIENYFGISNVALSLIPLHFKEQKLHDETHFIVQSIEKFSYDNFKTYYRFWVKLKPEKPLFLFFHLEQNLLDGVVIDLPAYCFYRSKEYEKVNGNDFRTFISDSAQSGIFYQNTDICKCEPITFSEAVPKLKSLKRI